jgi:hypothetical protein
MLEPLIIPPVKVGSKEKLLPVTCSLAGVKPVFNTKFADTLTSRRAIP